MNPLGLSLLVGGAALVVSGLIFLLATGRQRSGETAKTNESLETISYYLREIRQQRTGHDAL